MGVIITNCRYFNIHFTALLCCLPCWVMMSPMQNTLGRWPASLRHYLYMCLLMSSPERLPYHPQAIALNIFAYFLVGLLLVSERYSYPEICGQIVLQLVLMALIAYLGLNWKHRLPRFVQTYSALTGVTLLIDAATIPLHWIAIENPEAQSSTLSMISLVILFWNLAILSLIFKRAFEISNLISAMISFNYFVFYFFITYWLFG